MGKLSITEIDQVKKLYYTDRLSMREVANKFNISIDAVVHFMRKHNLKRRNFSEINLIRFNNKPLTYKKKQINSAYLQELKTIGTILYWGEGYKSAKGSSVDFANSDPDMIKIFVRYLRDIYEVKEDKLRVLLYYYGNQNRSELIEFWSKLTNISKNYFSKPYVRKDFNINSNRKMKYGLVHIRYSDKKLLLEIKKEIEILKNKYN